MVVGVCINVSASSFQNGCLPTYYRASQRTLSRSTSVYRFVIGVLLYLAVNIGAFTLMVERYRDVKFIFYQRVSIASYGASVRTLWRGAPVVLFVPVGQILSCGIWWTYVSVRCDTVFCASKVSSRPPTVYYV